MPTRDERDRAARLDNRETLHKMTPHRMFANIVVDRGRRAAATSPPSCSGGDDLRDRLSTTLVVAWMSPPCSCLRAAAGRPSAAAICPAEEVIR